MISFKEFMQILNEKKGDFGFEAKPPKPECFGKKIKYAGLKQKVCAYHRKRE